MRIDTSRGPAAVDLDEPGGVPRCLLVLTHGAGAGVDTADLVALRDRAVDFGAAVARVTQPYRVAGRRSPGAGGAAQDEAWRELVGRLRAVERFAGVPLVVGGRSNGARVACRTAAVLGADAVVALAFPLNAPAGRRKSAGGPGEAGGPAAGVSRLPELRAAGAPVLVVNGDRDRFGVPAQEGGITVVLRPGEGHDLAKDPAGVAEAVVAWLAGRLAG